MSKDLLVAEIIPDCTSFIKGKELAQYILEIEHTGLIDFKDCYVSAQFFSSLFEYLKRVGERELVRDLIIINIPNEIKHSMEAIRYYCWVNNDT